MKNEKHTKKVVLKIGTDALTNQSGEINDAVLSAFIAQAVALRGQGYDVLCITSGAVGQGRKALPDVFSGRLNDVQKSVAAGIGQPRLMQKYSEICALFGFEALQILAENVHFHDGSQPVCLRIDKAIRKLFAKGAQLFGRRRAAVLWERIRPHDYPQWNLKETLDYCFAHCPNVLPVMNENDVLSRAEIRPLKRYGEAFSDNDGLCSLVARLISADAIVIVSSHSLYASDPRQDPLAKPIPYVNLGSQVTGLQAQRIDTQGLSNGGTGGMANKIGSIASFVQEKKALCGQRLAYIISADDVLANGLIRAVEGQAVGTEVCCLRGAGQKRRLAGTPFACVCR